MYWRIPKIFSSLFTRYTWYGNRNNKTIYITFDDGPTPEITEKVFDILKSYNAKATFFCLGRNVERHQNIFNKIIENGHAIGNHTYSHLKGWHVSLKSYIQDTNLANQYINSKLFRPPYGRIRKAQSLYIAKTYKIIMWDVLSHDYNQSFSPNQCLRHLKKNTKNGSIVVFHDSVKASKNLLETLPLFMDYFAKKGYKFDKITTDSI